MKIICISGHAQSGKDTTAQIIRKILWGYGHKVLIIHYADLLKYLCRQLFHWDGEKDEAGRTLLQHVGTDVVRAKDPDFWVRHIADVLDLFNGSWDYILIPDCRFPNEISVLRERFDDVLHLRVYRDVEENGLTNEQTGHPSETSLDDIPPDARLINDGSLTDLTQKALHFISDHYIPIYHSEEAHNGDY